MKCAGLSVEPYALPLIRPLPRAAGGATVRRGLLIRMVADTGQTAYGDVAPLAGLSEESLDAALAQLEAVAPHFAAGAPCPDNPGDILTKLAAMPCLYPSVRFGLETAAMNLLLATTGADWSRGLHLPRQARVRVNALIAGLDADGLQAARDALAAGYQCLKIKVGVGSPEEEGRTVAAWRAALGSTVSIRLDANRAWSLDEALRFAAEAEGAGIAYIEEPVRAVADLPAFRERSSIPIALDESLGEIDAERAATLGAVAWIIKPSLRGGIAASLALAQAARRAGAVPIVSSAFESGVGRRVVAQLAALIHEGDCAAGLDTGSWFATDVMGAPLVVIDGMIDVDAMPGTAHG